MNSQLTTDLAEMLSKAKPVRYPSVPHDPNAAYEEGTTAHSTGDETLSHLAIKEVPPNSNIALSDATYWVAFMGTPVFTNAKKIENYMVGCAGVVFNDKNEILVGERLDLDGNPVDALMGGKPESGESLAEGLARELKEEVNLDLPANRYQQLAIREAWASTTQRCLTAYFAVKLTARESALIENMEPHKCFKLKWLTAQEVRARGLWQDALNIVLAAHLHASNGLFD